MCSQGRPMRSIAPGAKFSTSTSEIRISCSITAKPSEVLVSMARERLLLLSMVKYRASRSGMSRSWLRVTSPPLVRSTFSTSAPNHASSFVQAGPACTPVKSMTLIPASGRGFVTGCPFLGRDGAARASRRGRCGRDGALGVQVGDVAALRAGARVEHAVDEGRSAGAERRPQGRLEVLRGRGVIAGAGERLDEPLVVGARRELGGR